MARKEQKRADKRRERKRVRLDRKVGPNPGNAALVAVIPSEIQR